MNEIYGAAIIGAMAIGVGVISALMHINGKDGSGWGFVALCLIITSCSKANQ